jgi:hypothetical protein
LPRTSSSPSLSGVGYTGHLLVSHLGGPAWLSGDDAGPEGSVLALPIFATLLAVLWAVYRRRPAAPDPAARTVTNAAIGA